MTQSTRFTTLVQSRLDDFLSKQASILLEISGELRELTDFSQHFLRGGKRFRALFCYWGWEAYSRDTAERTSAVTPPAIVSLAAALELFHAAALVHDDIVDHSDTRRGSPSAHRMFQRLHTDAGWSGNDTDFGQAAAIMLGDLLLSWSDELAAAGFAELTNRDAAQEVSAIFSHMRTEVIAGQYLDILSERAWRSFPDDEQRARAETVVRYKSARYSVEAPLLIGAAAGGATVEQRAALSSFGLPLGIAYQLRDDLLGVYGDEQLTGKPAADDLREGKRTVLIAITRERISASEREQLDAYLGSPKLNGPQIKQLQDLIERCGARAEVEKLIEVNYADAQTALAVAPITNTAHKHLTTLAETAIHRDY